MNRLQRIRSFLSGIVMLLGGVALIFFEDKSLTLITLIIGISLLVMGLNALFYYFTMARYMVGGKAALVSALFMLDFGAFTIAMYDASRLVTLMYLTGLYAFTGLVSILRAIEIRRYKGPWKLRLAQGVGSAVIAAACIFSRGDGALLVLLYSAGLIYSAILRIIAAFRKTELVFVQ